MCILITISNIQEKVYQMDPQPTNSMPAETIYIHLSYFNYFRLNEQLPESSKMHKEYDQIYGQIRTAARQARTEEVTLDLFGVELLRNLVAFRYRDLTYDMKVFRKYWISEAYLLQYVQNGIKLLGEFLGNKNNAKMMTLEELYWVVSVLDSINQILIILPIKSLFKLTTPLHQPTLHQPILTNPTNPSSKKPKKTQPPPPPKPTSILHYYIQLVNNLPNYIDDGLADTLEEHVYRCVIGVRKEKIWMCLGKVEAVVRGIQDMKAMEMEMQTEMKRQQEDSQEQHKTPPKKPTNSKNPTKTPNSKPSSKTSLSSSISPKKSPNSSSAIPSIPTIPSVYPLCCLPSSSKRKHLKSLLANFNKIFQLFQSANQEPSEFLYSTGLEKDIRFVLQNLLQVQKDSDLINLEFVKNVQMWFRDSYNKGKHASNEIQRIWGKILEFINHPGNMVKGNDYQAKQAIIFKYFTNETIEWTFKKDSYQHKLSHCLQLILTVKTKISQFILSPEFQSPKPDPKQIQKFINNLIYCIKQNYDKLALECSLLDQLSQTPEGRTRVQEMYQRQGKFTLDIIRNHELSPYEIYQNKVDQNIVINNDHIQKYLDVMRQVAKGGRTNSSCDEIGVLWARLTRTDMQAQLPEGEVQGEVQGEGEGEGGRGQLEEFRMFGEDYGRLMDSVVWKQLAINGKIVIAEKEGFGDLRQKLMFFIDNIYQARQKYRFSIDLKKIQKLLQSKRANQSILMLLSPSLDITALSPLDPPPNPQHPQQPPLKYVIDARILPKTYQLSRIIRYFYSKNRSQVKFCISQMNNFRELLRRESWEAQIEEGMGIGEDQLVQIVLFLYRFADVTRTDHVQFNLKSVKAEAGAQIPLKHPELSQILRTYQVPAQKQLQTQLINTSRVSPHKVPQLLHLLQSLKQNPTYLKLFKILTINENKVQQFIEIRVELRRILFQGPVPMLRFFMQVFGDIKMDGKIGDKDIQAWYFFLDKSNFRFGTALQGEDKNSVSCYFSPLQAILTRFLLPQDLLAKKLQPHSLNYPFIHFTGVLKTLKGDFIAGVPTSLKQLFSQQFDYCLNEIKAIEMENPAHSDNSKKFMEVPIFWDDDKRMTAIVSFSQTFNSQFNLEQARRKKNEFFRKQLQSALKSQQNKSKQNLLQKILKQFHSRTNEQKPSSSACSLQSWIQKQSQKLGMKKYADMKYQTANRMNMASSYFYVIQGVFQKDALLMDLCHNRNQNNGYPNGDQPVGFGHDYNWFQGKEVIKKFVADEGRKQQMKKLHKYNYGKPLSQQIHPTPEQINQRVFRKTYRSFKSHLYFLRCFLCHSQKTKNEFNEQIEMSLAEKIQVICENYPKFFIFLYKWRHIIGKPMYEKSLEEFKENNQQYENKMKEMYLLRNKQGDFQGAEKLRLELPEYLEKEGSIKHEIVKVLKQLFPENRLNNNNTLEKLEKTRCPALAQYNETRLFPGYKNYKQKLTMANILNYPSWKIDPCLACKCFAFGIMKGYTQVNPNPNSNLTPNSKQKRNIKQGYVNLYKFLNEVKQANFNYLFNQHQAYQHCVWTEQENVCYYYYHMMLRRKIMRDQRIGIQDQWQGGFQAIQRIFSSNWNQSDDEEEEKEEEEEEDDDSEKEENIMTEVPTNSTTTITSWDKFIKKFENKPGKLQKLKQKLRETDYIPKGFLFHLLINYPNFIEDLRHNRDVWDQRIYGQH